MANFPMSQLAQYITTHAERGACQCGKCADAPSDPKEHQPTGHTADLCFFKVRAAHGPTADELRQLVREHKGEFCDCDPLDGNEHGYIELGAWIGDQSLALMLMGLGHLLGLWQLMTPNNIMPYLDEETRMKLAGAGYVTIKVQK